jgi:hypothetical protein
MRPRDPYADPGAADCDQNINAPQPNPPAKPAPGRPLRLVRDNFFRLISS